MTHDTVSPSPCAHVGNVNANITANGNVSNNENANNSVNDNAIASANSSTVASIPALTHLPLAPRIDRAETSATLLVDIKAKELRANGVNIISYAAGEPDFVTPNHIVQAAHLACDNPANYRYSPTEGLLELREAIAQHHATYAGFEVDPNQVVVTNGGKQAVYETLHVLVDEGDEVIIPAPYWTSYPEIVKLAGGTPICVFAGKERNFEPDMAAIEVAITKRTKAIIVNSPNNPTGAVYSKETLQTFAQLAMQYNLWLIVDDIYERVVYDDTPVYHCGALVPQVRDRLIELNGFAKAYAMTGWRLGWVVAPLVVASAIKKLQGHMTSNVSNIVQRAGVEALSADQSALEVMRQAFDVRRRAIVEHLRSLEGVDCPMPAGAFYVCPDVTGLLDRPLGPRGTVAHTSLELAAALLEEVHIAAVPGEAFGAPGYLRFSYALDDAGLHEGMQRLHQWVQWLS